MCRCADPLFFLNEINPGFQSSLRPNSKLWIKVSQFDGLLFIEMPLLGKVPLFNVNFSVSENFFNQLPQDIMSLNDLNPDDTWPRQVDLNFLTNIIFRIILIFNQSCLLERVFFVGIIKLQKSCWFSLIVRNQWLSLETINSTIKLSWLQQFSVLIFFLLCHLSGLGKTNQLHMSCWLFVSLINRSFFKESASEERNSLNFAGFETKVFKVRSQYFSALVPLRDNIQIFSDFTVIILVCFDLSSFFLASPAEESELDCLGKSVLFFSLQSFFFIFFFLLHDSFNLLISDCPLFDHRIFILLFSFNLEMQWFNFRLLFLLMPRLERSKPILSIIVMFLISFFTISIFYK